jgi:predicted RecB family nuclease
MEITVSEELRIMREFIELVATYTSCMKGPPKLWHWYADERFWNKAVSRQFDANADDDDTRDELTGWSLDWNDLYKVFISKGIVVRGALKYGLKDIASALHAQGLIDTYLDSDCTDGMTAMIRAWNWYKSSDRIPSVMQDLVRYNQFDCEVLRDILEYLRKNHIEDRQ